MSGEPIAGGNWDQPHCPPRAFSPEDTKQAEFLAGGEINKDNLVALAFKTLFQGQFQ